MDLNRLSKGEQIAGIAALILFISSFIKLWGSSEVSSETNFPEGTPQEIIDQANASTDLGSFSLWEGYGLLPKLGVLLALLLVIFVVAKAFGALGNVNLPIPLGLAYLGLSAITVLTMLVALLAGPEGDNEQTTGVEGIATATYELQRGLLLFLGILLSLAMLAGSFLHTREEGTDPRQAIDDLRQPGPRGPTTPPGT
ncbi:MAG: hypothetical protein M3174_00990 [Actinomycetota bacterium]|nr:hypothetical protein [Actinomycetota bacterium]